MQYHINEKKLKSPRAQQQQPLFFAMRKHCRIRRKLCTYTVKHIKTEVASLRFTC